MPQLPHLPALNGSICPPERQTSESAVLADFSARNPTHAQRKVYPWGTGPTTWLSPDAKIQFAIRNDSGSTINASVALLWQATPCNPRDASIMSEGIVPRAEHMDLFRGLTRFRPFRFKS